MEIWTQLTINILNEGFRESFNVKNWLSANNETCLLPERGVGWGEAEVFVDALKRAKDGDVEENGVVLVVGEEDSERRADALRGKLHDELAEVELLLGGIRNILKNRKNLIKLN